MFLKRLGQSATNMCPGGHNCPQIIETRDRNFVAVGTLITRQAKVGIKALPPGPGIGPKEGVVKVPRAVMIAAIVDILKAA
jgi:hypothetical protein